MFLAVEGLRRRSMVSMPGRKIPVQHGLEFRAYSPLGSVLLFSVEQAQVSLSAV